MADNTSNNNTPQQEYQAGDKYEIPYEGSLGLLALGHIGLKLWREKRAEVDAQRKAQQNANKQE